MGFVAAVQQADQRGDVETRGAERRMPVEERGERRIPVRLLDCLRLGTAMARTRSRPDS